MPGDREPVWIETGIALAIHDRQLAEHGGLAGVRDMPGLEAVLARARHQWTYGECDLCVLAAAYAYGIARTHPFIDGNKRTAWVLTRLFLALNGVSIAFAPADAVLIMLQLAAGSEDEQGLANWLTTRRA